MRKKNLQPETVSDNLTNPEIPSTLLEVMEARQYRQEGTAKMMKRLQGEEMIAVTTPQNRHIEHVSTRR